MGKVEVGGLGLQRMVQILPGETKEIAAEYVVAKDAALGRYDIWADVTGVVGGKDVRHETGDESRSGRETRDANAATFSAYCYAVVNEPILMDFRGHHGEYHVWFRNLTDRPIKGSLSAKPFGRTMLPFDKGGPRWTEAADLIRVAASKDEVEIPPRSVVRVPVTVTGVESLVENANMAACFKSGVWPFTDKKLIRVKSVKPVVPNRDFEIDHAGDQKPDWWMARSYMDWSYECMNLSTNAHSGKYALELRPDKRNPGQTGAGPTICDCEIGKTYKFTFWVKGAKKGARAGVDGGVPVPNSNDWVKVEQVKKMTRGGGSSFGVHCGEEGPILIDDITVELADESKKGK